MQDDPLQWWKQQDLPKHSKNCQKVPGHISYLCPSERLLRPLQLDSLFPITCPHSAPPHLYYSLKSINFNLHVLIHTCWRQWHRVCSTPPRTRLSIHLSSRLRTRHFCVGPFLKFQKMLKQSNNSSVIQ